jgi:hypothetical protein
MLFPHYVESFESLYSFEYHTASILSCERYTVYAFVVSNVRTECTVVLNYKPHTPPFPLLKHPEDCDA